MSVVGGFFSSRQAGEHYLLYLLSLVVVFHLIVLGRAATGRSILLSALFPVLSVSMMFAIFAIGPGEPIAQFVAFSEWGMRLFIFWAGIWPWLLGLGLVSCAGHLVWISLSVSARARRWLPYSVWGLVVSTLVLFMTFVYAPTV